MAESVVVIDYGSGNVRSMLNALALVKRDDQQVQLSRDAATIEAAERIVLPGVGAFAEVRRKLESSGVLPALTAAVAARRPLLGVCVGMQILADEGREFETSAGLGWISGVVRRLHPEPSDAALPKLPHVGWTPVTPGSNAVFDGIRPGTFFYFVHSYVLDCVEQADVAATASYGETFAAAVQKDAIVGCQFHPEKSASAGLRLLGNFCRWFP